MLDISRCGDHQISRMEILLMKPSRLFRIERPHIVRRSGDV